jgi:hypothetical protein
MEPVAQVIHNATVIWICNVFWAFVLVIQLTIIIVHYVVSFSSLRIKFDEIFSFFIWSPIINKRFNMFY